MPVDFEHCQGTRVVYSQLPILGGNVLQRMRCPHRPHWLLQKARGLSMSLCDGCAEKFIREGKPLPETYSLEWLV